MSESLETAAELYSMEAVQQLIGEQAGIINAHYTSVENNLPVVCVTLLNGGIIYAGMLLPKLNFPLLVDSLCVSRYREHTSGADLRWHSYPRVSLKSHRVLLLDDIYDQGVTLHNVAQWCFNQGAETVDTAVLALKLCAPASIREFGGPDFHALTIPDKFVVGLGMDKAGKYRNAPGIYVLRSDNP